MVFNAVLSNREHPEYGQVTIPFPFPEEHYDYIMSLLKPLEIGDPLHPDCQVDEIGNTHYTVLKAMEGGMANVDELDYLARRLESFWTGEDAQFQCMASKLNLTTPADLINLTFCCQQATAITDFSKLESAGRDHMMNLNGGCMPSKDYESVNGAKVAKELIASGKGEITPYGVVFDNGMELEQVYDGLLFPVYLYSADIAFAMSVYPEGADMTASDGTVIYFPCNDLRLQRALERGGIDEENMQVKIAEYIMPEEVFRCVDFQNESLETINKMAAAVARLEQNGADKLRAAVKFAEPANAHQLMNLAKHLEDFDFAPGVKNYLELGQYMIRDSGAFEYDGNLEGFYNYESYGTHFAASHGGSFNEYGYISYEGVTPLQEILTEGQKEAALDFEMGGM